MKDHVLTKRTGRWRLLLSGCAVLALVVGWVMWYGTQAQAAPASVATAPAPVLRVVCFGDSLTGNRPGQEYRGTYLKYADLLGFMLEGRLGVGRVEVINSGWAGDKTTPKPSEKWPGAVGRLKTDVLDHKPDIAIVLIGGNDRPETPEAQTVTGGNLNKIAQELKAAGIHTLMMTYAQPYPSAENQGKGWSLAMVNPLIESAAKVAGHPTLDLDPPIKTAVAQWPAGDVTNTQDGVHLGLRGEAVVARAIFTRLDDLGWIKAK